MYLDFLVKVPTVKGKITRRKKSNVVYIEYEYDRVYDPSRKYTFPKRVTIGKLSDTDPELMKPNQNFLKYFPDAELPESKNRTSRSSCLRVGTYFVLRKIIEECSLNDILGKYFGSRDMGLFLDLAVYSIIAENNAAQYYPDYTYNVSAKYCYAAHESRLHQNDRCKRFALCLVLTVRFRSLAPWGKLFQLFI